MPASILAIAVALLARLPTALLPTLVLPTLVLATLILPGLLPWLVPLTLLALPLPCLSLSIARLCLSGLPVSRLLAAVGLFVALGLFASPLLTIALIRVALARLLFLLRWVAHVAVTLATSLRLVLLAFRWLAACAGIPRLFVFCSVARVLLRLWPRLASRRRLVDDQGLPLGAGLVGSLRPGIDRHPPVLERRSRLSAKLPRHQQRAALERATFLFGQENDLLAWRPIFESHFQPHPGESEIGVNRSHPNPYRRIRRHPQGRFLRLLKRNLRGHVREYLDPVLQVLRDQPE